jgi:hypothetical protein
MEPGSLSPGSSSFNIFPRNDFRDSPTQSGLPKTSSSLRSARTRTSQSCQGISLWGEYALPAPSPLKKPMPGSRTICCSWIPASSAIRRVSRSASRTWAMGSDLEKFPEECAMARSEAPWSFTTAAIFPSFLRPETSLTMDAPLLRARSATEARRVSTDTMTSTPAMARRAASMRSFSSSSVTSLLR